LDNIRKQLPKKFSELHTQINIALSKITLFTVKILFRLDFLKNDKDLSANKYFGIYKDVIDLKITKFLDICFYDLQVKHNNYE